MADEKTSDPETIYLAGTAGEVKLKDDLQKNIQLLSGKELVTHLKRRKEIHSKTWFTQRNLELEYHLAKQFVPYSVVVSNPTFSPEINKDECRMADGVVRILRHSIFEKRACHMNAHLLYVTLTHPGLKASALASQLVAQVGHELAESKSKTITYTVWEGVVLDSDRMWRHHSWVVASHENTLLIIETTGKRLLYFGRPCWCSICQPPSSKDTVVKPIATVS